MDLLIYAFPGVGWSCFGSICRGAPWLDAPGGLYQS
jgi:hypothetical protein